MSTFAYAALDRTHCTISSIQVNLIEHKFYTDDEEYRNLIDKAVELLSDAYQVAGRESYDVLYEENIK